MSRDEVAVVQSSVEKLCAQCEVANVGDGMPRAADLQPLNQGSKN